jgi:predicted unusual protein kinase regulating ubiquinone biosynthesis (AarF/ABC1/UbiB family)
VILDFGCVRDFDARQSDGVLKALIAFWEEDPQQQLDALLHLGFGEGQHHRLPTKEAIAEHHRLVLQPMARYEEFNFSKWHIHEELRTFLSQNFNFIYLTPPAELIMYLRVIAGIKGTLSQVDAGTDIRALAEACCRRRGLL